MTLHHIRLVGAATALLWGIAAWATPGEAATGTDSVLCVQTAAELPSQTLPMTAATDTAAICPAPSAMATATTTTTTTTTTTSAAADSPKGQQHAGEIKPFTRGITQNTFIPKGQWITGVSVSYSQSHQDNYTFFVLEHLNGDTYSFKVSPMLFYAFKDNLAAGGRFAYQRSRTQIDSGYLNLGQDTNYDIDHLYRIAHNFYVGAGFRNYLSLGQSLRFGFFNEVQLQLGGGQSKIANGSGEDLTGTYETNFNLSLGLQPGLVVFLNNYSALEVSVGVLGFEYTHTHATTDQIYESKRNTKSANFRINLFSIQFGAAFYL